MADSGSTVHAMDVKKELPRYKHLVRPVPSRKKGRSAETACGGKVEIEGEIDLTGEIDGAMHTIPFYDMQVSMPIASMRRTVKAGNDLLITEEGGCITNRLTKQKIILHERCGVYFFKMTLLSPSQQPQKGSKSSTAGFHRQA